MPETKDWYLEYQRVQRELNILHAAMEGDPPDVLALRNTQALEAIVEQLKLLAILFENLNAIQHRNG